MELSGIYRSVCFTGHRVLTEAEDVLVSERLRVLLRRLYDECGTRDFFAGGATGFDTLAAREVLSLREEHPDVRLNLILPCRDQSHRWNEHDRTEYAAILTAADTAVVMTPFYYNGCMLVRDRALVEAAELCVACMRPGTVSGGTAYTVRCAGRSGIPVINLMEG